MHKSPSIAKRYPFPDSWRGARHEPGCISRTERSRLPRLRSPACEILLPARAPRAGPRRGRRAVRRGRRGLGGPGPAPVGRRGDAARKMASRASPREVSNHTASSAMAQLSVSASSCGLDFRGLKPVSRHRAEGVLCQESQSPTMRGREAARPRGREVSRPGRRALRTCFDGKKPDKNSPQAVAPRAEPTERSRSRAEGGR